MSSFSLTEERAQLLLRRFVELNGKTIAASEAARAYLASRGITDLRCVSRHQVGFCDGTLASILPNDRQSRSELVALGVLDRKGADVFKDCVAFPVFSPEGRIENIWFFPTNGAPAKLLTGRRAAVWNVLVAKRAPNLLVTESPLDGLSLEVAGHWNVIAVHPEHGAPDSTVFSGWGVQKITIVVGCTAGAQKTGEAIKARFAPHLCGVAILPECESPNASLRKNGPKVLGEAVTRATQGIVGVTIPGMQPLPGGFTLVVGNRRYEVRGLERNLHRLKATVRVEINATLHVDTLDLNLARARRQLVIDIVRAFDLPSDLVEGDIAKLLQACEVRLAQPDAIANDAPADPIPEADRREAEAMGRDPKLFDTIVDDYERCGVVGERANKQLMYVAMTSRLMRHPLPVLTLSSSGTGKSTLQNATLAFCPPEQRVQRSIVSSKALFHKEGSSLKHKALGLEEDKAADSASYPLRILISAGELTTEVATRDPSSGRLVTVTNRVEGPVAVFVTTSAPDMDPETKSRFFVTSADESAEQTLAILDHQRQQHTLDGLVAERETESVYRRHHAFQRILQPLRVVNPLVERLKYADSRLSSRRDQPKILSLIAAVAFVRQLQKTIKTAEGISYIEVDDVDMRIAAELVRNIFGRTIGELSRPGYELLMTIDRMRAEKGVPPSADSSSKRDPFRFTCRQVREFSGWPHTRVYRYLQELIELEYVIRDSGRRGFVHEFIVAWERPANGDFGAPMWFPFDGLNSAAAKPAPTGEGTAQ